MFSLKRTSKFQGAAKLISEQEIKNHPDFFQDI